jgi:hypothetical protein
MIHDDDIIETTMTGLDRPEARGIDADAPHSCEFCSPEPGIMPLPRSGAARAAEQNPAEDADQAIGELMT